MRHADIHEDDVRSQLPCARHSSATVLGFAHNFDAVVAGKYRPKTGAHEIVIVYEEYTDRLPVHGRPEP